MRFLPRDLPPATNLNLTEVNLGLILVVGGQGEAPRQGDGDMTVTITIHTENAAFDPMYGGYGYELANLLKELADKAEGVPEEDLDGLKIMDSNGNKVGEVSVK